MRTKKKVIILLKRARTTIKWKTRTKAMRKNKLASKRLNVKNNFRSTNASKNTPSKLITLRQCKEFPSGL